MIVFSRINEYENLSEHFVRSILFSGNYCGSNKISSLGPKKLLKPQIFEKKVKLSSAEKVLTFFSRVIDHNKCQATIRNGPKGILTVIVRMIRSFLLDLRGR